MSEASSITFHCQPALVAAPNSLWELSRTTPRTSHCERSLRPVIAASRHGFLGSERHHPRPGLLWLRAPAFSPKEDGLFGIADFERVMDRTCELRRVTRMMFTTSRSPTLASMGAWMTTSAANSCGSLRRLRPLRWQRGTDVLTRPILLLMV